MTGPEHYEAAGRWLYKAENQGARGGTETAESCAAIAYPHASPAAAAAAAALNQADAGMWTADWQAWRSAAGVPEPDGS